MMARQMRRWYLVALGLVAGFPACGERPVGGDNQNNNNSVTTADCWDLASRWNEAVGEVDGTCADDQDCMIVGGVTVQSCNCQPSVGWCGRGKPREAYAGSLAEELEDRFHAAGCDEPGVCDCPGMDVYCNAAGFCNAQEMGVCHAPPCETLAAVWTLGLELTDTSCFLDDDCIIVGGPQGEGPCAFQPAISGTCGVAVNAQSYASAAIAESERFYSEPGSWCSGDKLYLEGCPGLEAHCEVTTCRARGVSLCGPVDCAPLAETWQIQVSSVGDDCFDDADCLLVGGTATATADATDVCACQSTLSGGCGVAVNRNSYLQTGLASPEANWLAAQCSTDATVCDCTPSVAVCQESTCTASPIDDCP